MATLNTLRTRFGVVLSAVIAFALLAFIFSLKSEMGFSGNDPVVAEIDGEKITYTEYLNEYNNVQRQSGVSEIDEEQADRLYAATWQALVSKYILQPGFEGLGLDISEAERMAIIRGEIPTQALYSVFGDPNTGAYDVNALNSFLFTSQGNPEAEQMWANIMSQAIIERMATKYAVLTNMGANVNDLEVEVGVNAANKSFSGRWASKSYSSIPDSEVSVSEAEIKSYYDAHKQSYKRQPTRTISYVEFLLSPSAEDRAAAEAKANELSAELKATSNIRAFVRESRSGSVATNYVSAAGLPSASSEALVAGKSYGPQSDGEKWTMSRVEDTIYASDTLNVSHIVLPYTDEALADSLLVALKGASEAEFAAAATTHSQYQSAQSGGLIGDMAFSLFSDDLVEAVAPMKRGDVVKVATGNMIQLIRANSVGPRVKHYRVATIDVPITPSQQTRNNVYNNAGLFAGNAKGGVEKFKSAASESGVSLHNADLTPAMRTVEAVGGSQEVARWAHRADVGDLSEIFKVDDGYLVATLVDTNSDEYSSLSSVKSQIEQALKSEKKFEIISSQLSGSTFDAQAKSLDGATGEFEDTTFSSYFISGVGVEPRLIGAIATSEQGAVSNPIEGHSALYIFVVDEVNEVEEQQTAEAEKLRAEVMQQQMIYQMLFASLESMADVKDLRGENL